jgi:hypothetical protein
VLAFRRLDIGEDQRGKKAWLRVLKLDGRVVHAGNGRHKAQAQA